MRPQKNIAPPVEEDVTFAPRIQRVIDIVADSIVENIRREPMPKKWASRTEAGAARAEKEGRLVEERHANPVL